MSEERLSRMEDKLDKLSEAVVEMARIASGSARYEMIVRSRVDDET